MNSQSAIHGGTKDGEATVLSLAELVTWLGCVGVGIAGLLIPYPRPKAPAAQQAPTVAQIVHVQLTNDQPPAAVPDIAPPAAPNEVVPQPPAPPAAVAAPAAPAMAAVAVPPSPAITFAQPAQTPPQTATHQPDKPQRIVYGQGEGRQPAPEYPPEAATAHQQGSVVVRFIVGQDGRVQSAQAYKPCPFPLLNQSAVRAVRETWRFRPGPVRNYEVTIQFQLQ